MQLRTTAPLMTDPYRENRATGAFILIDEASNETVGAGMVTAARAGGAQTGDELASTWTQLLERLEQAAAAGDAVEPAVREALEALRERGLLGPP